jgi:hypothetical protein
MSWNITNVRAMVSKYSADQTRWAERHMLVSSCLPGPYVQSALAGLLRLTGPPEDGYAEAHGNLITTQGLDQITKLLTATSGGNPLSNTYGICGVGQGSLPSPAIGDTALIADGTALAWYQAFDSDFPAQSDGVISGQATVASGNAQFYWNEWCWAASTAATGSSTSDTLHTTGGSGAWAGGTSQFLWNHSVPASSLGLKGATAWIFETSVTIS